MEPLLAWLSDEDEDERYVIVIQATPLHIVFVEWDGGIGTVPLDEPGLFIIGVAEKGWRARHGASSAYGFGSDL